MNYNDYTTLIKCASNVAPIVPMRYYGIRPDRCIILRHDIDLDFYPSINIYKLEKNIGIKSTFFVRIDSDTYNARSWDIGTILRLMHKEGFEIGLHFDPSVYEEKNLDLAVKEECKLLQSIVGAPILSVALHKPSLNGFPEFKGLINAYNKLIFSDEQYISDSMFEDHLQHPFRGKDPLEFVMNAKKFPLQINIHPEQVFEKDRDYTDTITRYLSTVSNTVIRNHKKTIDEIRRDKLWSIK